MLLSHLGNQHLGSSGSLESMLSPSRQRNALLKTFSLPPSKRCKLFQFQAEGLHTAQPKVYYRQHQGPLGDMDYALKDFLLLVWAMVGEQSLSYILESQSSYTLKSSVGYTVESSLSST